MTQTVTDAQGQVHNFPDEATPEMISEALGLSAGPNAKPGQQVGVPNPADWNRLENVAGNSFVQGAIGGAGIGGQLEHGVRDLVNGLTPWQVSGTPVLPTPARMTAFAAAHGAGSISEYEPRNVVEQYVDAGARGAGGVVPLLPLVAATGGLGATPALIGAGAGGGVGAMAARQNFPNVPGAEDVGALLGGLAGGNPLALAQRGANALMGNLTPNARAFADAGIAPRSAAFTTASPSVRKALAPYAPVDQVNQDLGGLVESSASATGSDARTWQEAGTRLQNSARDWVSKILPSKIANAWAPVDQVVPSNMPVTLSTFGQTLHQITSDAGNAEPLAKMLRPQLPDKLKKVFDNLTSGGTAWDQDIVPSSGPTLDGSAPHTPFVWQDVQNLRSALGDAMANPKLVQELGAKNTSALYAALTTDMRSAAGVAGAGNAFDTANAESTRLYNIAEGPMSKVISGPRASADDPNPENVAKSLIVGGKTGASDLSALQSEIPDGVKHLSAVAIRQLGLSDPTTADSIVSNKFMSNWRTMSPEAKAALVPDAAMQNKLEAAASVQGNVSSLPKGGGKPSTPAMIAFGQGGAALGVLGDFALNHFLQQGASLAGEAVGGATGELVGNVTPWLRESLRSKLANNALMARLAGAAGPKLVPGQNLMGGLVGGTVGQK